MRPTNHERFRSAYMDLEFEIRDLVRAAVITTDLLADKELDDEEELIFFSARQSRRLAEELKQKYYALWPGHSPMSASTTPSTGPDPIFAAIEHWKEALAAEKAAFHTHGDGSDTASTARIEAMHNVFGTVPTTLAGMRAKIDFATSVDHVTECITDSEDTDRLRNFLETLYESAQLIAGRSAAV
jgi:hypothetical protein